MVKRKAVDFLMDEMGSSERRSSTKGKVNISIVCTIICRSNARR